MSTTENNEVNHSNKVIPAASKVVGTLYENIITQVLQDVKPYFEEHGVDEETLQELQKLWESKLVSARTVPKYSWQDDDEYEYEENEELEVSENKNTKEDDFSTEDELKRLEKIKKEQKELKQTALLDNEEVNSDLDDSDDDYLNTDDDIEENGEENGNIILCQYEKVGRVKNKWKWVLKDGVVSINGKDYCFKKATGESDW